jgi:tRNA 2-selenouridine synthase
MGCVEVEPDDVINDGNVVFVDVRSPSEFRDFHIPGAVNVPLFDDQEKRLIGYIYRTEGVNRAVEEGRSIASAKLGELFERFKELSYKHKRLVVYCWRGGMRSEGVCTALTRLGLEVYRLRGGYRAYRKFILKEIEKILKGKKAMVITGKTGSGKTRMIRELKREGYDVLDLEGLANHRGSLFGKVGIEGKVSQKMFDSLVYEEIRKFNDSIFLIEDESRRIGHIHIPQTLWEAKQRGIFVEVEVPLEERVRIILEDYTAREGWQEEVNEALKKLARYLGPQKYREAVGLFKKEKYEELVAFLIENHYDRRYRSFGEPSYRIRGERWIDCLEELRSLYNALKDESKVQDFAPQRG